MRAGRAGGRARRPWDALWWRERVLRRLRWREWAMRDRGRANCARARPTRRRPSQAKVSRREQAGRVGLGRAAAVFNSRGPGTKSGPLKPTFATGCHEPRAARAVSLQADRRSRRRFIFGDVRRRLRRSASGARETAVQQGPAGRKRPCRAQFAMPRSRMAHSRTASGARQSRATTAHRKAASPDRQRGPRACPSTAGAFPTCGSACPVSLPDRSPRSRRERRSTYPATRPIFGRGDGPLVSCRATASCLEVRWS
jgi:hypothetical protein